MSAQDHLLQAYSSWRRWTEVEAEALRQADWPLVTRSQTAKDALQPLILQLTEATEREWRQAGLDLDLARREIRSTIAELLAMEGSNNKRLAAQREGHRRREAELKFTQRNLRQVHRSYAPRIHAGWQSYG
jgi:hypothetical protein